MKQIMWRCAAALWLAGVSVQASAQEATQDAAPDPTAAASAAYARGNEHFAAGRFSEAEAAFEEAYAHVNNAIVLVSIGRSREGQQDYAGALEAYEAYLAASEAPSDEAEIRARIESVSAHVGVVNLVIDPADAQVEIDGELVQAGQLRLNEGARRVVGQREGMTRFDEVIEVQGGDPSQIQAIVVTLRPEEPAIDETGEIAAIGSEDDEELDDEDYMLDDELFSDEARAEDEESSVHPAVWAGAGLTIASLITGTVLGVVALDRERAFNELPTEALADKTERLAIFADVMFGLAAFSAIATVVLFFSLDDDDEEDEASARFRVSPAIGPTLAGAQAQLQF